MTKLRGNKIYFDRQWKYVDTGEPTIETYKTRACGHCLKPNRADDHDSCLGELPGVINACCGHGNKSEAYVQYSDERIERGEDALRAFQNLTVKEQPK